MKKSSWIIFAGIILIAVVLRFWQLGNVPAGFHVDEADYGYNAYSLFKTGKDEYGKPFPLIYRSLGDYKGAIYAYLTIPFVAVAGLNEWAVRAPSAVFGIFFIILTFALVGRISQNYRLALLSMALAAISPLGILLSRVQSDPLVGAFFFYVGFYLLLTWVEKKKLLYILLSFVSLYVGFYTYSNDQLFVLPFLALLAFRYWQRWDASSRITMALVFVVLCATVIAIIFSRAGTRLTQVNVFSSQDVQLPLAEKIREDGASDAPLIITRILHNKVTAYGQYFLNSYMDYFSYDFLFKQASQPSREMIPNSGVLMIIDLPFLLIGIYTVLRKKLSYGITAVLWLLMVPVMLIVARDETPNIHRFIWAAIPLYLLCATGILAAYNYVQTRYRMVFIVCAVALFLINGFSYLDQMFNHQPVHNPIYRNNADKDLALALKQTAPSYDVVVSQKILEHILFFWPVDPAQYQKDGSPRDTDNGWYHNILFVRDACPALLNNPVVRDLKAKRILYVTRPECPKRITDKVVRTITYGNTLDAYYLIEERQKVNN